MKNININAYKNFVILKIKYYLLRTFIKNTIRMNSIYDLCIKKMHYKMYAGISLNIKTQEISLLNIYNNGYEICIIAQILYTYSIFFKWS